MTAEYKLRIKDTSGILQAEVTDFQNLAYVKEVNAPGLMGFSLNGEHEAIQYLTENIQIEVWRRDETNEIDWYADFHGFVKDYKRYHDGMRSVASFQCPGQMSMLAWRNVLWTAGYEDKSAFENKSAEFIIRELYRFNATVEAATDEGRLRSGVFDNTTMAFQVNEDRGNFLYFYCAYKNLLESMQTVASIGDVDFELKYLGLSTWLFKVHEGQLGTDRTDTVLFSLGRGNMTNPEYSIFNSERKTVAVVAGQGEGSDRAIEIVTSADYDVDLRNYEMSVDARDIEDTGTALVDRGSAALAEAEKVEMLRFDVLQIPSSIYGRDYFLGDLVTATYEDITRTPKIQTVSVELEPSGKEIIDIGMKTV